MPIFKYPVDNTAYSLMPDNFKIKKVLLFLDGNRGQGQALNFLSEYKFTITQIVRGNRPGYKTYKELANNLKKDINIIRSKFFNRDTENISENEWIYQNYILNDEKYTKYSAHFKIPGKQYSCACDLSVNGLSENNISNIVNTLKLNFPTLFIYHHSVKGNAAHIHIEDKEIWNLVENSVKTETNLLCGYDKTYVTNLNIPGYNKPDTNITLRNDNHNDVNYLSETDLVEQIEYSKPKSSLAIKELNDNRKLLPSEIQNNGLMEVLKIGDISFDICPVTQISYSQSMQFNRFSTLRTVGDPKIATDTIPNNLTLNIIFPNKKAINNQLKSLIAQFKVTPFTKIQNRFAARVLKPMTMNHKGEIIENKFESVEDESLWMVMTDMNVRSIPEFPEAMEVFITLEMFEDRVFGNKLSFLKSIDDLKEKYRRKNFLLGESYILPSEKSQIERASNYKEGVINTTQDPNDSELYKNTYELLINQTPNYSIDNNNILEVSYNDSNIDRANIKKTANELLNRYNEELKQTAIILREGGDIVSSFLKGQGIGILSPEQIKSIVKADAELLSNTIAAAASISEIGQFVKKLRYYGVELTNDIKEYNSNFQFEVDGVVKDYKLTGKDKEILQKIINKLLGSINVLLPEKNLSAFKNAGDNKTILEKMDESTKLPSSTARGLISSLETLISTEIFNDGLPLGDSHTPAKSQQVKRINEAIIKLVSVIIESPVDDTGLGIIPFKLKSFKIADGENRIITGVSFAMSNKIVPQQVIGWRQPTFQHLGRSDWSINLNIIAKGDEAVKDILYMVNKTALFSKQIQYTSPQKFINLKTELEILNKENIFEFLGVKNIVLNSIEVSSVANQPNLYQISLGLEQADLTIRQMESLKENKAKINHKSVANILSNELVPVLKSYIIREDHPSRGRFLDYDTIKSVIDSHEIDGFWKSLNIEYFDYMDKYYFFKVMLQLNTTAQFNVEDTIKKTFPNRFELINILEGMNKIKGNDTVLNPLFELVQFEIDGKLISNKGYLLEYAKPQLESALRFYYEQITNLENTYIQNNIIKELENNPNNILSIINNILLPGAVGGASIVLLASNPIGWKILAVAAIINAGILAYNYVRSTTNKVNKSVNSLLPSVINLTINDRLRNLCNEVLADPETSKIFGSNFKLGSTTLQDKINNLRNDLVNAMDGCYKDYEIIIASLANKSGLHSSVIDPAFYLFSENFITGDLIKEQRQDVLNRVGMLDARVNILNQYVRDNFTKNPDESVYGMSLEDIKKKYQTKVEGSLITIEDINYVEDITNKLAELTEKSIINPTKDNISNLNDPSAIYTDAIENRYYSDANFKALQAEERKSVLMDAAFAKILLVNEALKFDALRSTLESQMRQIAGKFTNINNKDDVKNFDKLNQFFNINIEGYNKPLYQLIIDLGGIEHPFYTDNSLSANAVFKKIYKEDIKIYFKDILEVINQVDIMARCKQALANPTSARFLTQYQGLIDDPRMLNKRMESVQSIQDIMYKMSIIDNTGNPIRLFPTYKVYFIEEDAPEWGIYHDFYDYSAIQEITVVKDRKSASDTCVIKLSNVAGKLTDTFADNLPEFGTQNLPLSSIMLKPGMSILVKLGYSNSQVELPVVFQGIITEVQPGPLVEVVCQGYGAELNEVIAPEGKHHGVFGDVKAHGDVATWTLQEATGLNHFGKLGFADIGISDRLRMSGNMTSGTQGKSKLASFLTNLPGLSYNDPIDDNIFLPYNMSNIKEKEYKGITGLLVNLVADKLRVGSNINFDWYIRDDSIYDVLKELMYFQPDYALSVLPYNDNIFPYIPKIRNTVYLGPRRGYYKYTDLYSIISKEEIKEIDLSQIDEIDNLLLEIINIKIDYNRVEPAEKIRNILKNNDMLKQSLEVLFGIDLNPNITIESFGIKKDEENIKIRRELAFNSYLDKYTIEQDGKRIRKEGTSLKNDIKKFIKNDVGLNGIYYNLHGDNHQYKKLQNSYIVTSYTNLLNNNIIASANGWANQIKLVMPSDPTVYKDINEYPVKDRDELITETFNLDDDILNDHIRTKEVYMNNIDPSLWDDSIWSKRILNGESTWLSVSTKDSKYSTLINNKPIINDIKKGQNDKDPNITDRPLCELLPSRWRVGISILAEEARDMYNGELTIIGDGNIKPYDIIHLLDYTNDMHGSVEVGRVIHTISPQTGFITRIKPDLIVNQKNKFNEQELFLCSKLSTLSNISAFPGLGEGLLTGVGSYIGYKFLAGGTAALLNKVGATTLLSLGGTIGGAVIAPLVVTAASIGGYKIVKNHHERVLKIMGNMIGRDSLDILPLTYRDNPYVAGVEGIRKNSYMRRMYSTAFDSDMKASLFERVGYANSPIEYEYYRKILGDSELGSLLKTMVTPSILGGEGKDLISVPYNVLKGLTR